MENMNTPNTVRSAARRPAGPSAALGGNLLGPEPTLLPQDHPDMDVRAAFDDGADLRDLAARHPDSSLAWALLAREAFEDDDAVAGYAFARVGYHRGLDSLRRAGWRGQGPIPASHEPNRGFLECLVLLGRAAEAIGEQSEVERITDFIRDSDPTLLG